MRVGITAATSLRLYCTVQCIRDSFTTDILCRQSAASLKFRYGRAIPNTPFQRRQNPVGLTWGAMVVEAT